MKRLTASESIKLSREWFEAIKDNRVMITWIHQMAGISLQLRICMHRCIFAKLLSTSGKWHQSTNHCDFWYTLKQSMSNLTHHERLYQFIKHKERVLKAKPVVDTRLRSKSMPGRPKMSSQKRDEERKIREENERLLKSLLKISERKPKYL